MNYKVLYHLGNQVNIRTKAKLGQLSLEDGRLIIRGENQVSIPIAALHSSTLFRLHGIGRMLRVGYDDGDLFISVIRFSLFGIFSVVNFFATGKLQKEIEEAIQINGRT